jgi:iron(III) transport system permease protein
MMMIKRQSRLWLALPFLLLLPMVVVFASWLKPDWQIWQHLAQTVLGTYLLNSVLLAAGTGFFSLLLGGSLAFLVARYQFSGRTWLSWALVLPLAMPAYIVAYSYAGLLDAAGPLQTQLRELTGWRYHDYWFPQIRSLFGAILILSLVLYPYVYLLARQAFSQQNPAWREAARSLASTGYLWKVALPLARPALLGGTALVMMEAFADYGTVAYFGVPVLTTGIFRVWFGMGDVAAAAQLSAVLCTLAILLVALELWNRRQLRYFDKSAGQRRLPRQQLTGWRNLAVSGYALLILTLGFLLPAAALLVWSLEDPALWFQLDFAALLANSVGLAAISALIIVAAALVLVYGLRRKISTTMQLLIRGSGFGYAIPGTVIAIGVLWPFSQVDAQLDLWAEQFFGIRTGLILTGTIAALVFAYLVRFIAVAMQPLEAAFNQIPPSMDQAARSLGCNRWQLLWRVHRPLLAGPVWIALLLVFVDVLKELPATLLLRPFNFDTLAVRTFELASDEQLAAAAVPALTIVLAGLLPLIWLNRAAEGSSHAGH